MCWLDGTKTQTEVFYCRLPTFAFQLSNPSCESLLIPLPVCISSMPRVSLILTSCVLLISETSLVEISGTVRVNFSALQMYLTFFLYIQPNPVDFFPHFFSFIVTFSPLISCVKQTPLLNSQFSSFRGLTVTPLFFWRGVFFAPSLSFFSHAVSTFLEVGF